MDRSGNRASAKPQLGRRRVIVDAARDFAGVVDGSPQWADEQMVAQFDFRIHDAVLEAGFKHGLPAFGKLLNLEWLTFLDPFDRVLISTRGDPFSDRTASWTRDLLASLGRADTSNQHALQIIGHDPVIATRFRAGEAAAAVLAANATAAADLWCARGGRPQRIEVDVRAAAASLVSFAIPAISRRLVRSAPAGDDRSLSSARRAMDSSARRIQFARRHARTFEMRR